MFYLHLEKTITPGSIARSLDTRARLRPGFLEDIFLFEVLVEGELAGYIVPPTAGGRVWGINLFEIRGWYREVLTGYTEEGNFYVVREPSEVSEEERLDKEMTFALAFFRGIE